MRQAEEGLPRLIKANKAAIQRVAEELLNKSELRGDQIDGLLKGLISLKAKQSLWSRLLTWFRA
jgi:hypothetical protein